jgi:predicted AAA+ superfamily ATPase
LGNPYSICAGELVVDQENTPGRFILTGSTTHALSTGISQSLAGRTAIGKLLPFTYQELTHYSSKQNHPSSLDSYEELIWKGMYPRIWEQDLSPTEALSFYYSTYIERDVRLMLGIKDLNTFQLFVRLIAGRVGQILNLSSLANDVGIAVNTAKQWISILENSFILFRLEPYFANLGKRLIKSPKIYFWDPGLAAWLIGIREPSQLITHPLKGQLFENLIVSDLLKQHFHKNLHQQWYFFRDSNGNEADLILQQGNEYKIVEIKSAKTLAQQGFASLKKVRSIINLPGTNFLIYGGEGSWDQQGVKVRGWRESLGTSDLLE